MEKTWRWFGSKDRITLSMLKQIGVEGIVTALHEVKNGEIWTLEAIEDLKAYIESYGMRWSVVESLPVCEAVKYAGPERDALIENYKISLANLGKAGIRTVCYNFMPVLDWARTDLTHPWPDGTTSLFFDYSKFAYFDIKILKREGAEKSFPENILKKVEELDKVMTEADKHQLVENIIVKTQGFVNGNISEGDAEPVRKFKELLDLYKGITAAQLRENMKYFLEAIMPVCDEYGINMCVHPDDPPMPEVFGLPRIITSANDVRWLYKAVDNFHNGLTFCAGSLSAGAGNDVEIVGCPLVRESDGLALSSRNVNLKGNARQDALCLHNALMAAKAAFAAGERDADKLVAAAKAEIDKVDGAAIQYIHVADPDTLTIFEGKTTDAVQMLMAVRVGGVRLIDNMRM